MVLIIEGKKEMEKAEITIEEAVAQARELVEKGFSINQAAREIAAKTPFKKGDIYRELI